MASQDPFDDYPGGKSRSQKKRESTALQERGEELASLGAGVWKTLPLTPPLREGLEEGLHVRSREALRRHRQYIGRLMRELDEEEREGLLDALDALKDGARQDAALQHRVEDLRDALLHESEGTRGAALERALAGYPELDPSRLRHLVEAALADREKRRPPKHSRELFRYLRDSLRRELQGE